MQLNKVLLHTHNNARILLVMVISVYQIGNSKLRNQQSICVVGVQQILEWAFETKLPHGENYQNQYDK